MRGDGPLVGLVGGVVVGVVATVALAAAGLPHVDGPAGESAGDRQGRVPAVELAPIDEADARAFVAAWRRSLTGTYVAEGVFQRVTPAGASFTSDVYLAQRPPERLSIGRGAVSGRRRAVRLACALDEAGALRCREVEAARTYRADVAEEIARLEQLVLDRGGGLALYTTEAVGDGCFVLRLRFGYPAPPYGTEARFCFDPATGAPVLSEILREGGTVDRTELTSVDPTVTDADLAVPEVLEPPSVSDVGDGSAPR